MRWRRQQTWSRQQLSLPSHRQPSPCRALRAKRLLCVAAHASHHDGRATRGARHRRHPRDLARPRRPHPPLPHSSVGASHLRRRGTRSYRGPRQPPTASCDAPPADMRDRGLAWPKPNMPLLCHSVPSLAGARPTSLCNTPPLAPGLAIFESPRSNTPPWGGGLDPPDSPRSKTPPWGGPLDFSNSPRSKTPPWPNGGL